MPQKRPVSFVILAILNFVAAVTFIFCGVCTNITDANTWFVEINGVRFDEKKLNAHVKEKAPGYTAVKITGIILGYGICIGLIGSGVALLFGGLLSKLLALLVYAVGFLHHAVMIVYQLVWVNPAIHSFFDQVPAAILVGRAPAEAARFMSLMGAYSSIAWWVAGCLFYLVAAPIVLYSFMPSKGKDADDEERTPARKARRRRDDEDDEDDEEDDRPRRRSER